MYIFISYSSKNTDEATNICKKLENEGQTCFLAYRDIVGGSVYAEELVNAIEKADAVLLLLSEGSNKSPHVLREVERSCSKNIPIVVYKLEDVVLTKSLEYFLMTHQWVTKDDGEERLIGVFKNLEKRQSEKSIDESEGGTPASVVINTDSQFKVNKVVYLAVALGILLLAFIIIMLKNNIVDKENINADEMNVTEAEAASSDISEKVHNMQLGDSILIGCYRDEPIEWVALHKNDDGSTILISKNILCLKMFDAPESGELGTCSAEALLDGEKALDRTYWTSSKIDEYGDKALIEAYGNNDWSVSNIRCWLNADKNLVTYEDSAPGIISKDEKMPSYVDERGFLKNFTIEEKNALSEYTYTYENSITGEKKELSDKVFLLSEDELEWFYSEDISPLAKVNASALDEDYEAMYENYNNNGYFFWWLRDGSKKAACMNRYVSNSMDNGVYEYISSYYGYGGIRPCIRIE